MIPKQVKNILGRIYDIMLCHSAERKLSQYFKTFNLHPSVRIFQIQETTFRGNINVGEGTYFNRCWLETGSHSSISIGKRCAIGFNVFIMAITHDINKATGPENERPAIEADITIGDDVWIGVNVYIREGIKIGSHAVIGANSVVTKDIPDFAVAAGVPAKVLKIKER